MNIYDIAELAGVSIATVSRVVNGSPRVSEKTKRKVLSIMEEYNYTPNVFARGLGLNSMQTIGIVCPDVSDVYVASAVAFLDTGAEMIRQNTSAEQQRRSRYSSLTGRSPVLIFILCTAEMRKLHMMPYPE